ncbi:DASH complex subunit Duo1-domain-containing protein [Irpex rosettiformis]|uniref:DASH complex subunit Duo1-domain-containing protein n=1 Tax=Irpex rosettiformis TaxID=378272 RepID=A0ACB8TPJ8_9APHY|nr:DASH complex subunit Duo1-domain-containing protein [Irpex rosettiformis]
MRPEDIEKAQRVVAKSREERLQSDLFTLKKINAAFDVYKEALRNAKSSTDCVAEQLANTNALLDKYVTILAKSEKVTRLLLDEKWEGAEADEAQIEHEVREEEERLRQEEEERELTAQRERERLEREEEERKSKVERERLDREKQESVRSGSRGSGVRGVRGTRASMRGMRGSTSSHVRSTSTTSRSTPPSASSSIPSRRAGSTATSRGSSRVSTVRK